MRAVLDTCVLYPTVMREMLLGVARLGAYEPLWSPRILEEWARAAQKLGPLGEPQARAEIALLRRDWQQAEVTGWSPALEARLWLPDPADVHVLALAVVTSADVIVTVNARDFPRGTLAEEGLARWDPDAFLRDLWAERPAEVLAVGARVLAQARNLSGEDWDIRSLMKKARLPRLGRALAG